MMQSHTYPECNPQSRGFTLMEVMAAIFLTSIVITFAVSFYIDIAKSSQRAIVVTRTNLRATGVLDKLSRDLSNTALVVKAEDDDPLGHPWFFMAESRQAFDGSDLIKFNTRSKRPGEGTYHDSDLVQVSYQTATEDDGSLTLYRWSSPGAVLGSDMDFPSIDDEHSYVVAEGLGSFSMRFLSAEGEWLPDWDSTQIEEPRQIPQAIEIVVSMWKEQDPTDEWEEEDQRQFVKQIVLHQEPLDLNKMVLDRDLAEAERQGGVSGLQGASNTDDQGNSTESDDDFFGGESAPAGSVADCARRNWALCVERYGEGNCGVWANVTQVPIGAFGIDLPWCQ
jgi:prepilin-type N-terminal cleavage/methylation domain-containing protein